MACNEEVASGCRNGGDVAATVDDVMISDAIRGDDVDIGMGGVSGASCLGSDGDTSVCGSLGVMMVAVDVMSDDG